MLFAHSAVCNFLFIKEIKNTNNKNPKMQTKYLVMKEQVKTK